MALSSGGKLAHSSPAPAGLLPSPGAPVPLHHIARCSILITHHFKPAFPARPHCGHRYHLRSRAGPRGAGHRRSAWARQRSGGRPGRLRGRAYCAGAISQSLSTDTGRPPSARYRLGPDAQPASLPEFRDSPRPRPEVDVHSPVSTRLPKPALQLLGAGDIGVARVQWKRLHVIAPACDGRTALFADL